MLSAAKHLAAARDRPFASLRVALCDCSNGQGLFFTIEPCLMIKSAQATKFWQLLVMTARTMVLVKGGEIRSGVQLAIQAANECRATGNLRYLERIYAVQQYLDGLKREIEQISTPLRETLDEGHSTEL